MTAPKSLACVFDAHGVCGLAGCSCPCHQNEFIPILNIGCQNACYSIWCPL
jgi:hypothetical protein